MDGDGFSLTIRWGDKELRAVGYIRYPDGYEPAQEELETYLGRLLSGL